MARVGLGLGLRRLAEMAGVGGFTVISKFERGEAQTRPETISRLREVLEGAGAEFMDGGWVRVSESFLTPQASETLPA
jgi:transcriptional regulator with XRE-family HTH domain